MRTWVDHKLSRYWEKYTGLQSVPNRTNQSVIRISWWLFVAFVPLNLSIRNSNLESRGRLLWFTLVNHVNHKEGATPRFECQYFKVGSGIWLHFFRTRNPWKHFCSLHTRYNFPLRISTGSNFHGPFSFWSMIASRL